MHHLLAGGAAASHVEFGAACDHGDAVVVGACGPMVGVGRDLDVVDVLVAVRLLPQLLHDLVYVRHLGRVERQQRLLQRLPRAWNY